MQDDRALRQEQEDERGASLIEYALLVGLIAIVCIVAIQFLGGSVSANYSSSTSQMFGS